MTAHSCHAHSEGSLFISTPYKTRLAFATCSRSTTRLHIRAFIRGRPADADHEGVVEVGGRGGEAGAQRHRSEQATPLIGLASLGHAQRQPLLRSERRICTSRCRFRFSAASEDANGRPPEDAARKATVFVSGEKTNSTVSVSEPRKPPEEKLPVTVRTPLLDLRASSAPFALRACFSCSAAASAVPDDHAHGAI